MMKSPLLSQESSKGEKYALLLSHNSAHGDRNSNANISKGNYPFWPEWLIAILRLRSHILIWQQQSQVKTLPALACSQLFDCIVCWRLLTCGSAGITVQQALSASKKASQMSWYVINIRSSLGWSVAITKSWGDWSPKQSHQHCQGSRTSATSGQGLFLHGEWRSALCPSCCWILTSPYLFPDNSPPTNSVFRSY